MSPDEQFLLDLVADLDQPACVVDRAGVIQGANDAWAQLAGRASALLLGSALREWLPASDAEALCAQLGQPRAARRPISTSLGTDPARAASVRLSVAGTDPAGGERFMITASPIGEPPAAIPDRKLLELTAILENAAVGVCFTRDRTIQHCNHRWAEIFGYPTPAELIGKPAILHYPDAESYERIGREAGPLLADGRAFQSDWLLRKADGSPVWCRVYGKAVDPSRTTTGTVWIAEEITQAKLAEEMLRQTLRSMEAIMLNAPVGITFTHDRRMVHYNPEFGRMFGFEGNEGVALPARVLYRSDAEYRALGEAAAPLLSKGLPYQTEMFMRRQDGSDFWVNLIGYVQDPENTGEATIWITEDRTVFKRAEEKLQRSNAELAEARNRAEGANRAKSEFLANMSHELRTPLNAMLGYAQLLQRDPNLQESQRLGLGTIQISGEHLLALINDILDLARIEAGRLVLALGDVNLPNLLRVVADIIRGRAKQKDLAFEFDVPATLPQTVCLDEKRVRQILLNLLGNAVKFTGAGQVSLRVGCVLKGDARADLHIEVEDTGMGISAENIATIFEPFEQLGDVQHRSGGAGLGLAISRTLARLMGGDINVESRPGRGSRFWFDISVPVTAASAAAAPAERLIVGYEGPPKRVLVVDDVSGNRGVAVDFLSSLGFEVFEATDGREALSQAAATQPDLILMDNTMPVMSGLEATRRLREQAAFRDLPIIAVSASVEEAQKEASLAAGATDFLPKPLNLHQLSHKIGALLQLIWTYRDAGDGIASSS